MTKQQERPQSTTTAPGLQRFSDKCYKDKRDPRAQKLTTTAPNQKKEDINIQSDGKHAYAQPASQTREKKFPSKNYNLQIYKDKTENRARKPTAPACRSDERFFSSKSYKLQRQNREQSTKSHSTSLQVRLEISNKNYHNNATNTHTHTHTHTHTPSHNAHRIARDSARLQVRLEISRVEIGYAHQEARAGERPQLAEGKARLL